ncbi:MAG: hypothetical protein KKH01_05480 [Firmicutes bacterium]|nr:hypothetical protein [Bacillota bacterium]
MKKILGLLLVVATVFGLVACTEAVQVGEFPELDENKLVEMNAQEMVDLFSTLDYTGVSSESVRIGVNGSLFVDVDNTYEDSEWDYLNEIYVPVTYYDENITDITIDAVLYAAASDQVSDVELFAEGTFDIYTYRHYSSYYGGYITEDELNISGEAGMYFTNQSIYMRTDITGTQNEESMDTNFKEKLNTQFTQDMWDEYYNEVDTIEDPSDLSGLFGSDIITLLESGDIDQILEEIPNLKVYQDGTTYSIQFTLNKTDIVNNFVDVFVAVSTEMGQVPTQDEIDEMEQTMIDQINTFIDELELDFVITIEEGRIVQIATALVFVGSDDTTSFDIDMAIIIDFGASVPKFPSDLDEYDVVSDFGIGSTLN